MKTSPLLIRVVAALGLISTAWAQPVITKQPTTRIATPGGTATFSVLATGTPPLTYQWRFGNTQLRDQTNRSVVLRGVQQVQVGDYSVLVGNAYGSVTSRVVALMFTAPHALAAISANVDHTITLDLSGVSPAPLVAYYDLFPLEVSANLVDWSPRITLLRTNDAATALRYLDTVAAGSARQFYRTPTNALATPFPAPSGPHAVGTVSRLLTDPSRTNRYNIQTNSSFMITIWYPAESRAGTRPEPWLERPILEADPGYWGSKDAATLSRLVSWAHPGLPFAHTANRHPVILYSPTWSGRRGNTDKALELASHGYVVVGVDHIGVVASVFPSGRVVYGTILEPGPDLANRFAPVLDNAIRDLQFVVRELGQMDANDPLLAGRLDLEQLGVFGFSLGSVVAAEFCRIEPRCKGVAIFDPGYLMEAATEFTRLGLQKPFLSMNSTEGWVDPSPGYGGWLDATTALLSRATRDAFWFQLNASTHQSFNDKGSLVNDPTMTGDPTPASRAHSQTLRACSLSFFNRYLKREDDHLLDNPALIHTNIINFRRK